MDLRRLKTEQTDSSYKEVACVRKAGTVLGIGIMAAIAVGAVGVYAMVGGSSIPKSNSSSAYVTSAETTSSAQDQTSTVSQAAVTWKKAGIEEYDLVVETVNATKESKKTTVKKTEAATKASTTKKSAETSASETKKSESTTTAKTSVSVNEPATTVPEAVPEENTEEDTVKDCAVKTMYAAEKVNMRKGPSLNDSVISVLPQATEMLVTGYTDDWYRVKADGVSGYCMKRYLSENKPASEESSSDNDVISYSDTEFNMLCYVLQGEVGNCSEDSKIAVANVIINRVKNSAFPDSIEGVLTQSGQFDAIWGYYNGSTVPTDNTIECAKRALAGENNVGGAIYYYAPAYCGGDTAAWFETLEFCAEIDGQRYFK